MEFSFLVLAINWTQVFVAAFFGGVGAGLGFWIAFHFVAPKLKGNAKKNIPILISVVIFSIFYQVPKFINFPFNQYVSTSESNEAINNLIDRDPILSKILERFPELRLDIVKRFSVANDRGGLTAVENEMAILGNEIGAKYLPKYIGYTPDAPLKDFLVITTETLFLLSEENTTFCFHWLFGGDPNAGENISKYIPLNNMIRMRDAIIEVLNESSEENEFERLTNDQYIEIQAQIIAEVESVLPKKDLNWRAVSMAAMVQSDKEKRQACLTVAAFYRAISNLPEETRIKFFRTLMAKA